METSILKAIEKIKNSPDVAMFDFVNEIADSVGDMGKMMRVTPMAWKDYMYVIDPIGEHRDGVRPEIAMKRLAEFDKLLTENIPIMWGCIGHSVPLRITARYTVVPKNRQGVLESLMGSPIHSFTKTTLNRRAWIRNEVYRSNVNFEGYAHWNAAVFYWIARKVVKMSEDNVNLVLRVIPFNETSTYRSIFAPRKTSMVGPGHHTSLLSPERYRESLVNFCTELSNVIINHRQRTSARYSSRDVTDESVDIGTKEIVDQIKHVYKRHREIAERVVHKKAV